MAKLAKGICPVCDDEWSVVPTLMPDENGDPRMTQVMRGHRAISVELANRETWQCLGSRQKPVEITREAS